MSEQIEWAIVEIMGHQSYAGRLTEHELAGQCFVRVDVPAVGGLQAFTKLFGPHSVYSVTPVSKEVALAYARNQRTAPVSEYQLRLPSTADIPLFDPDEDCRPPGEAVEADMVGDDDVAF